MTRSSRTSRPVLAVAAAALAVAASTVLATPAAADDPFDVLVLSKTSGFRHDSISAGVQAITQLGQAHGFSVTATEDAGAFTTGNLAQYEAVAFLNTTGDVLNDAQQAAFESYIGAGGGFVGIHSAADTEYDWPFYGELVGAYFASHPAVQEADVHVEDRAHPGTAHLPQTWTRVDEWYDYRANPRPSVKVLAALDESTYSGGQMGDDHPITWCQEHAGGRSFYTGGGHTAASYSEPDFRAQLLGGIRYAAGQANADCRPETGYTPLFDGSTTGWSQAGPGSFTNSDATLTSVGGGGLYWYSAKAFSDYSLKLDWRAEGDDNSGVFIGFPPSDDWTSAITNGYEVQIDATDAPDRTTGAVYAVQSADIAARDAALNPPGEWNTFELLVEDERLRVYLNGVLVNDFTGSGGSRSLDGHIGLQNHGAEDTVSFRNVRIKELGSGGPGGGTGGTVQAESFGSASGVQAFDKAGAQGGRTLGYIDPGDWAAYPGVDLTGVTGLSARVVSGGAGGTLQVRTGSVDGPVLGSVAVPNTGGWSTFADVTAALSNVPTGAQTVYLTFTGSGSGLFDVDSFTFTTGGTGGGGGGTGPIVGLAGKCLDVNAAGTADGTKIQIYGCNGTAAQQWTVGSDGTVRALGKCLDVAAAGTADGTKVQLWTCNGTGAQDWEPGPNGSLVNPASGKCLDVSENRAVDGQAVHLWTCYGGANQRWTLP
jgi:type 1 glutamine amidotransferase